MLSVKPIVYSNFNLKIAISTLVLIYILCFIGGLSYIISLVHHIHFCFVYLAEFQINLFPCLRYDFTLAFYLPLVSFKKVCHGKLLAAEIILKHF